MRDEVINIISDEINIDKKKLDDSVIISDLGINSLEMANIIFNIEDKFGIQINDEDISKIVTVGDIIKIAEEYK